MLRQLLVLGGITGALLIAGCGDDDSEPATTSSLEQYCEAHCGWQDRCGGASADCVAGCVADYQAYISNLRKDFVEAIASCLTDLPCSGTDDTCFTEAVDAVVPDAENDPDLKACQARQDTCAQEGNGTFSDDICGTMLVMVPSAQSAAQACLDKPCPEIESCLDALVGD